MLRSMIISASLGGASRVANDKLRTLRLYINKLVQMLKNSYAQRNPPRSFTDWRHSDSLHAGQMYLQTEDFDKKFVRNTV